MDLKIQWNFKKSDPIDLDSYLTDFVSAKYDYTSLDTLRPAIRALHSLRAAAVPRNHERESPDLEKLSEYTFLNNRYFLSLRILEPLINSQEGQVR